MRLTATLTACAVVALLAAAPALAAKHALSPAQKKEIESVVRDYILKNPEIIVNSIRVLQARDKLAANKKAKQSLVSRREEILNDPTSPVGGNIKGDVTVVEFFDYRCGFCKRVFPTLIKLIKDDDNIRFVYKEFPILGPLSLFASRAALAAWKLDKEKYYRFHDAMMASKGNLTKAKTIKLAISAGLEEKALRAEMAKPEISAILQKNFALAKALNINGTPAFVIGDRVVPGVIDLKAMQDLVKAARKKG